MFYLRIPLIKPKTQQKLFQRVVYFYNKLTETEMKLRKTICTTRKSISFWMKNILVMCILVMSYTHLQQLVSETKTTRSAH